MSDRPYVLTISTREAPHTTVRGLLSDRIPTPTVPDEGGWEEIKMPRRGAVIVWRGRGLMHMTVGLLFDRVAEGGDGASVAPDYSRLLEWWRPSDPTEEPPVLQISSPGDVVPYADLEWVLNGVEIEDGVANHRAVLTQRKLMLTLVEYRADERLMTADEAKKRKHRAPITRYRIQRKDIAGGLGRLADHFSIPGGWRELGEHQHPPIRDPRLQNKDVGRVLVIPQVKRTSKGPKVTWPKPGTGG